MKNYESTREMKLEWLERCANCRHLVYCERIAMFDPCEDYWEVDERQMVIVIEAGEHGRLKTIENIMHQLQW